MRFQFLVYSPDTDDLMGLKELIAMELERRFGRAVFDEIIESSCESSEFTMFFEVPMRPGFEKSALRDVRYYYSTCREIRYIDGNPSDGPAPPPTPKPDILPELAPSPAPTPKEAEQKTFLGQTRQK